MTSAKIHSGECETHVNTQASDEDLGERPGKVNDGMFLHGAMHDSLKLIRPPSLNKDLDLVALQYGQMAFG